MIAEPRQEAGEVKVIGVIKTHEKTIRVQVLELKPVTVNTEKCRGDRDGRSLVTVNKRMILVKTLKQGCIFYNVW